MNKNTEFSKKILIGMLIFLFIFIQEMIFLIAFTKIEPTILITSVFAFCAAEGGLMAWIKTIKTKHKKKEESTNGNSKISS